MRWRHVSIAIPILLGGCTMSGSVPVASDSFCATQKPMLVSSKDVLTDITARQILTYNEYGVAHCGWKPKGSVQPRTGRLA
jgi:hypothetical protein